MNPLWYARNSLFHPCVFSSCHLFFLSRFMPSQLEVMKRNKFVENVRLSSERRERRLRIACSKWKLEYEVDKVCFIILWLFHALSVFVFFLAFPPLGYLHVFYMVTSVNAATDGGLLWLQANVERKYQCLVDDLEKRLEKEVSGISFLPLCQFSLSFSFFLQTLLPPLFELHR